MDDELTKLMQALIEKDAKIASLQRKLHEAGHIAGEQALLITRETARANHTEAELERYRRAKDKSDSESDREGA